MPSAAASASVDTDATEPSQPSDGDGAASLGACPGDLATIIDAQSGGVIRALTSLDGTPTALLAAFPSGPVCAVDVAESDRVGRYIFGRTGISMGWRQP
jgi:hypothetical protein